MRKFLFLVLLAFLWSDLALAEKSCKNKMDVKRELDPPIVLFSFKSSCEHNFYVKTFNVKTSDGRTIKEEKVNFRVKPFGVRTFSLYVGDINTDVIDTAGYTYSLSPPKKTSSSNNFKQNKKKEPIFLKPDNYGYPNKAWGPIALIFLIVLFIAIFHKQIFSSLFKKTKLKKTKLKKGNNIFNDVWVGKLPLSRVFWIYFVLINIAVSFTVTLISYAVGIWIIVLIAVYNIWSGVGVWNSATNYKIEKLNSRKPYGYATAAKIYLIFNFIVLLSQFGLAIR